jgi:hypothetical protein
VRTAGQRGTTPTLTAVRRSTGAVLRRIELPGNGPVAVGDGRVAVAGSTGVVTSHVCCPD